MNSLSPSDQSVTDWLLKSVEALTPEQHRNFIESVRPYYQQLPTENLPDGIADLREVWAERAAIEAEAEEARQERRIFSRTGE